MTNTTAYINMSKFMACLPFVVGMRYLFFLMEFIFFLSFNDNIIQLVVIFDHKFFKITITNRFLSLMSKFLRGLEWIYQWNYINCEMHIKLTIVLLFLLSNNKTKSWRTKSIYQLLSCPTLIDFGVSLHHNVAVFYGQSLNNYLRKNIFWSACNGKIKNLNERIK